MLYILVSCNITNNIQKTWTESYNMVVFGSNIQTRFRYICYLDIFRFLYIITKFIQTQNDPTQNPHIKFIIFKRGIISKKMILKKNNSYLNG